MYKISPNIFLISTFSLIISLPILSIVCRFGTDNTEGIRISEQRELKTFKRSISSLRSFRKRFEDAFSDNFPMRNFIYKITSEYKMNFLNTSFAPKIAIVGQDGWLFLGDNWGEELKQLLARHVVKKEDVAQCISDYNQLYQNTSKEDIQFRYLVPPNKSTIYSAKLPKWYGAYAKRNWIDDVLSDPLPKPFFIDIRTPLLNIKKSHQVYYKADSHWNNLGAFIAYVELMNSLRRENPTLRSMDYDLDLFKSSTVISSFDISNMLFLKKISDITFNLDRTNYPGKSSLAKLEELKECGPTPKIINNPNALNSNSVLVFCDSFGRALIPYLIETFQDITFVHSDEINSKTVGLLETLKKAKFDVLLIETAERKVLPIVVDITKPLNLTGK